MSRIGYDDLDEDLSSYPPGSVVLGRSVMDGDMTIRSVASTVIPGRPLKSIGAVARIIPTPEEQFIVDRVNAEVDVLFADPNFRHSNPDQTRVQVVHTRLTAELTAFREAKARKQAAAVPNVQPLRARPDSYVASVELQGKDSKNMTDSWEGGGSTSVALPKPNLEHMMGLFQGDSALASLGIPGLAAKAFEPRYAELRDISGQSYWRFLYHWEQRIDNEAVLLIYDSRFKELQPNGISGVLAFEAATLKLADRQAEIFTALGINILPTCQVYRFGCFVIYSFILAE